MIDVGWSEMAVVALIALLILGPKELPQAMRMMARWVKKARAVSREFRSGVDEMIREAELEDARKAVDMARPSNLKQSIGRVVDPTGSVDEAMSDVESEARKAESEAKEAVRASDQPEGATIVNQPTRVALPHSLTPPPEPAAEDEENRDSDEARTRA
jgi:sec-independent protein translocase protein TatB